MEFGLIIFWVAINVIVGYLIGHKKNQTEASVAFSLFLGPLGWLIAALMPGDFRQCPFCAEDVKDGAIVCPHCQRDLPELVVPARQARNRTTRAVVVVVVVISILVIALAVIGSK